MRRPDTRRAGSYPSDLTDTQWQVIAAHLPAERPAMILWAMIALMTRRLAQPTD
jgi:hypothetical protein